MLAHLMNNLNINIEQSHDEQKPQVWKAREAIKLLVTTFHSSQAVR